MCVGAPLSGNLEHWMIKAGTPLSGDKLEKQLFQAQTSKYLGRRQPSTLGDGHPARCTVVDWVNELKILHVKVHLPLIARGYVGKTAEVEESAATL